MTDGDLLIWLLLYFIAYHVTLLMFYRYFYCIMIRIINTYYGILNYVECWFYINRSSVLPAETNVGLCTICEYSRESIKDFSG